MENSYPLLVSMVITTVCIPLKKVPGIPSWTIPFWCFGMGIVFYCGLDGFSMKNVLNGILVGGGAVGIHQGFKQGLGGFTGSQEKNLEETASKDSQSPSSSGS